MGKGDLLELRHDDEFDQFLTAIAPEDARAGDIIECRTARPMPAGALVRLIRSQAALDAAEAALKRPVARKRAVDVRVVAHLGQPFTVELTCIDDPTLSGRAEGFMVEAAKTRAVSAEDLVEHVGRMGSSPFEAVSFDIQLDEGCGMGFSAVHKVRAAACKALERAILAPYAERVNHLMVQSDPVCPADLNDLGEVCALVTSLNGRRHAARNAGGGTRVHDPLTTCSLKALPCQLLRRGRHPGAR